MDNLSFTQECFLCSLKSKGSSIFELSYTRVPACLVAGGIMELTIQGFIACDEKGALVTIKPWDDTLPYLKPLYETIASFKKPKTAAGVAKFYVSSDLSLKPLTALLSAFAVSIVEAGYADELTAKGLFKEKMKYAPKPEAVRRVIEKIRSEFLEDGTVTNETFCLTAMLYKCEILRNYFSKFEADTFKARIKELRANGAYALVKEIVNHMDTVVISVPV